MKTVTVHVEKEQLNRIQAEGLVVLTDGERQVTFERSIYDLEEDSPELAAELLKASKGSFTSYSRQDLEKIAEHVIRESSGE
jgi:hypothetical protein